MKVGFDMQKSLPVTEFLHGGDYNPEQWLDNPHIIDLDFNYFKKANINNITIGIFSWAKLEPTEGHFDFTWLDDIFKRMEKQNGHVILATPSGAKPRWLAEKYPETLRVEANGQRNIFGERHNHCFTSPVYRKKVQIINQKLAERYGKKSSLILWHISNEFGGACYCDLCQTAFRDWLKEKYKTLANLNHAYWADFWSHTYTDWQQVHSPAPQGDSNLLGLNLDWHRFVTDQTIDFYENETNPLRKLTPNIPITTNFMGGNPPESHVHYDLDYQKFAKHVDIISWDSYPNWGNGYESTKKLAMKTALMNDVMRSLKNQNYLIMESTPSQVNWHPFNRPKLPGMHLMGSLQQIAHGANSVNYFQLHQSRGSSEMFHGAVIDHSLSDQTRVFKEVSAVGDTLKKLKPALHANHQLAKVAIVYDYDNMWALDDARNYANETKKYWQTIQNHYQFFWEHDIPVDLISTQDCLTNYQLVIDPLHFMMNQQFADKLKHFVTAGGILIGTYLTGRVDENFLAYLGGWPKALQDIYGIDFIETDTLYPEQNNHFIYKDISYKTSDYCDVIKLHSAQVLATYSDCFYTNTPSITKNRLGQGYAFYLAARTNTDFLSIFYQDIVNDYKLVNSLPIHKDNSEISIQTRSDSNATYYFIINFSEIPQTIKTQKTLFDINAEHDLLAGKYTLDAYAVKILKENK